jgi:hypothetical protein
MALPGDPTLLDAVAARINRDADELRTRAARLVAAADAVRWHSVAATAFRCDVGALARGLRRAADDVDEAAHALRRHAATVRRVRAALGAAEHVAVATARGVEHAVAHLLGV